MTDETIKNLSQLLSSHLEHGENIQTFKIARLTKPGENYGSIMLKVDMKVKNEITSEEKDLNAAAKLIPSSLVMQKRFNIQVTYKNELEFYRTIVPTLQQFQQQQTVKNVFNCVAKFIAGRISLDPQSNIVDKDAVLMFENLRVQGYQPLDRSKGFDFKTAMLLISKMVTLHAVSLSLKLKKPELFGKNIKPYLADYYCDTISIVRLKEYVSNLIEDKEILQKAYSVIEKRSDKSSREPWAAVIQNDLWIGNTLVKFVNDEAVDAKIVDFQVCEYKSPVRDLVFFLFSSVRIEVLERHLDDLLKFYYEQFINILKELKVDTTPFTWYSFNEELKLEANQSEYYHVLWMLDAIHAIQEDVKDVNEYKEEDFTKSRKQTKVHQNAIIYMTNEFAKRGWI